jgi:hypothetical protein
VGIPFQLGVLIRRRCQSATASFSRNASHGLLSLPLVPWRLLRSTTARVSKHWTTVWPPERGEAAQSPAPADGRANHPETAREMPAARAYQVGLARQHMTRWDSDIPAELRLRECGPARQPFGLAGFQDQSMVFARRCASKDREDGNCAGQPGDRGYEVVASPPKDPMDPSIHALPPPCCDAAVVVLKPMRTPFVHVLPPRTTEGQDRSRHPLGRRACLSLEHVAPLEPWRPGSVPSA